MYAESRSSLHPENNTSNTFAITLSPVFGNRAIICSVAWIQIAIRPVRFVKNTTIGGDLRSDDACCVGFEEKGGKLLVRQGEEVEERHRGQADNSYSYYITTQRYFLQISRSIRPMLHTPYRLEPENQQNGPTNKVSPSDNYHRLVG